MDEKTVVYSLNVSDLQCVAQNEFDSELSVSEIEILKNSIGDYIDWYTFVTFAIHEMRKRQS